MPADTVKIRVRSGTSEAEIEADLSHIREAIELIPEVLKKLPNGAGSLRLEDETTTHRVRDVVEGARSSQLPTVMLAKNDSLTEIIGKFFAGAWGKQSRKLSDVREALQSYGLNYPKQSVAVALLRLAKTSRIRRFKAEDGEYVYTASTALITPQQPPPDTDNSANV